jgi:hypothetical protein
MGALPRTRLPTIAELLYDHPRLLTPCLPLVRTVAANVLPISTLPRLRAAILPGYAAE